MKLSESNHVGEAAGGKEHVPADYIVMSSSSRRNRRATTVTMSTSSGLKGDEDRVRRVTDEDSPDEIHPIENIAKMSMEEVGTAKDFEASIHKSVKPKVPSKVENEVFSDDRTFIKQEIEMRKERLNSKRKREDVAAEIRSFGKVSDEGSKSNMDEVQTCIEVNEKGGVKMSLVQGGLVPLDAEVTQNVSSGEPLIPSSLVREWGESRVATDRTTVKKKGGSSRKSASPYRSRSSVRTCTNCNKTGHDRRNCNKPRIDSNGSIVVSQRRCTRCGSLRHDRRTCTISAEDAKRNAAEESRLSRRQFALLAQQQKKAAAAAVASLQSSATTTKVLPAPPPQNPNPRIAPAAPPPLPTKQQPMPPYCPNAPNYGRNSYQGMMYSPYGAFPQMQAMQNLYTNAQSIHYYEAMQKQMKAHMESQGHMPTLLCDPLRSSQQQQTVMGLEAVTGTMAASYRVHERAPNSWRGAQGGPGENMDGKIGSGNNEDASDNAAQVLLMMSNK